MIPAGLGWDSLPAHIANPGIPAGRLCPIHVEGAGLIRHTLVYDLVWRFGSELGPATAWLATEPGDMPPLQSPPGALWRQQHAA